MGEIRYIPAPTPRILAKKGSRTLSPNRYRVAFRLHNGVRIVSWDDITYCASDSNYTHVHLRAGQRIVVSRSLGDVASKLPGQYFIRIHQSYLVNAGCIAFVGSGMLEMTDGTELPVARSKRTFVQEYVRQMMVNI